MKNQNDGEPEGLRTRRMENQKVGARTRRLENQKDGEPEGWRTNSEMIMLS